MDARAIFTTHIEEKKEEIIQHVGRVEKISRGFSALPFSRPLIEKLLTDSIWLHDIAKFDNEDNHNKLEYDKNTLTCKKKVIARFSEDNAYMQMVVKIIEQHKGKFMPPDDKLWLEAAILRLCDKIDKFEKTSIEKAKEACEESLKKIQEWVQPKGKQFTDDYEILEKQTKGYYRK